MGSALKTLLFTSLWLIVLREVLGKEKEEVTVTLSLKEQNFCPYFKNRGPSRQDNLKNCSWYKESSCCVNSELEFAFSQLNPIPGANKQCVRYLNYLYCYICAPDQNTFFVRSTLIVCEDFCDLIYDACKNALLKGMVIKELYASGKEFCTDRRFLTAKKSIRSCFSYDPNSGDVKSEASGVRHSLHLSLCFVYLLIPILQKFFSS